MGFAWQFVGVKRENLLKIYRRVSQQYGVASWADIYMAQEVVQLSVKTDWSPYFQLSALLGTKTFMVHAWNSSSYHTEQLWNRVKQNRKLGELVYMAVLNYVMIKSLLQLCGVLSVL